MKGSSGWKQVLGHGHGPLLLEDGPHFEAHVAHDPSCLMALHGDIAAPPQTTWTAPTRRSCLPTTIIFNYVSDGNDNFNTGVTLGQLARPWQGILSAAGIRYIKFLVMTFMPIGHCPSCAELNKL